MTENVRSEEADATVNVKYIRKSLCTTPNSVLATGVLLKASHMVRIFVTCRTSGSAVLTPSNVLQHIISPSAMLVKRFVKISRD